MGFSEFMIALVLAVAGGAAGAAVINGINERWKFKASRKAAKEDRQEEKEDRTEKIEEKVKELKEEESAWKKEIEKKLKDLDTQNTAENEALRVILLDRIRHLGQSYIAAGEIDFDDRRIFHMMHSVYHDGLGILGVPGAPRRWCHRALRTEAGQPEEVRGQSHHGPYAGGGGGE